MRRWRDEAKAPRPRHCHDHLFGVRLTRRSNVETVPRRAERVDEGITTFRSVHHGKTLPIVPDFQRRGRPVLLALTEVEPQKHRGERRGLSQPCRLRCRDRDDAAMPRRGDLGR